MERRCKGSLLLDLVKVVRSFPDLPWAKYLLPEDLKIIHSMVIPTEWYPIESYQRIGLAVYQLVAKGQAVVVTSFGRAAMEELFHGPYQPFLDRHDPFSALQKFLDLRKPLFNFSRMELTAVGEKVAQIKISELGEFDTGLDLFLLLTGAHFQRLVELNGGKEVALQTWQEPQKGDTALCFELAWK